MVDKATAKDYVKDIIGEQYIIPTYAVYNSVDEIKWEDLPDKFVIKTTHDSGTYLLCKNKKDFDVDNAESVLQKGLDTDYFRYSREWPYKNVRHRIIAEKLLVNKNSDRNMDDYKVLCFNGKAKLVAYHTGRGNGNHTRDFYDTDWNIQNFSKKSSPNSMKAVTRPQVLEKMIELSEKLAEGFPQLRVDWYINDEKLFFGELTLFSSGGLVPFEPEEWDKILGSWITLPEKRRI